MTRRYEFAAYCRTERRYSERTTRLYLHELHKLERHVGKDFMTDVDSRLDAQDLRRYIARRSDEVSLWALRTTVKAAKAWERFGGLAGWWVPNGIMHITLPVPPPEPADPLTTDELKALFEACLHPRQVRLLYLGLYAATRISETAAMTQGGWTGDRLVFPGKGGRVRRVPLHPRLERSKDVILSVKVFGVDAYRDAVKALRRDSGVTRFHPHLCRHTFSTRLLEAGVELPIVEALMGHAARSTTLRHYARWPWARLVDGMNRLSYC